MSISSGFPYIIHLIGDGCFRELFGTKLVNKSIVLNALESILLTDKREKFTEKLKSLNEAERNFLFYISNYKVKSIPAEIPYSDILEIIPSELIKQEQIDELLNTLEIKGFLYSKKDRSIFIFSEELFRIFISYIKIEMSNSKSTRREFEYNEEKTKILKERVILDIAVQSLISVGDIEDEQVEILSLDDKRMLFKEYIDSS